MSLGLELQQGTLPLFDDALAHTATRRRIHPALLYSILIVLCPLLAVPAFVLLGKSDFFLHHGASVWVQSNDAIFDIRNRQCDVLIFGDSTAMTGIDPDLVTHDTGFRTCNISVTNAVLAVTGNLTLDTYLRQNAAPKMLIIQLSPDDFQRENRVWNHTIYAEGMLELLRHGTPDQGRHLLLTHPHEALAFAGYAAGYSAYYAIKDVWFRATHLRSEEDLVQVRNGFFTPPAPPRHACESSAPITSQTTSNFAREIASTFQRTYARNGSVVLVDVAPIPSCDENLAAYRQELHGITSNTLQSLPIHLFNDQRHYTAFGSRVVSALIAHQVDQVALENPSLDDRAPLPPALAGLRSVALHQ